MYVLQRVLPRPEGPSIYIVFAVSRDTDKLKAWVENTYKEDVEWVENTYGIESVQGEEPHHWLIHRINDLDYR